MPTLDVLCLANSWKYGGRCVAGLRMDGGGWVRPVSTETQGVLRGWHYTLAGGKEAALLDVLRMPLACPQPEPHHPENWRLDDGVWRKVTRPSLPEVRDLLFRSLCSGPDLLGDCERRVLFTALQQKPIAGSLALVRPENLSCHIERSPSADRRRVRVAFTLADTAYTLPLTDPLWQKRLEGFPDGCHPWEGNGLEALLTISLSEPLAGSGHCYKLVAAIVPLPAANAPAGFVGMVKRQWRVLWRRMEGRGNPAPMGGGPMGRRGEVHSPDDLREVL